MSQAKRYKESVQSTIRTPKALARKAKKLVARLDEAGILLDAPGTREKVRPSIAVLALRGLNREINLLEKKLQEHREAVAACRKKGLKSTSGVTARDGLKEAIR